MSRRGFNQEEFDELVYRLNHLEDIVLKLLKEQETLSQIIKSMDSALRPMYLDWLDQRRGVDRGVYL